MTVPALHPAIGGGRGNRYCGPGALSILTGLGTGDVAAVIREVTGKPWVGGVHTWHLTAAAKRLGLRLQPLTVTAKVAVATWAPAQAPGRYLLVVANHYIVVRVADGQVEVGDNQSVYPRALEGFRRLAVKKVKQAWRVGN